MFAAAAIVAQTLFNVAIQVAKWVATKTFVIAILAIVLPWALREFFMWIAGYLSEYGISLGSMIMSYINSYITSAGGAAVDIELSGVGGYLAEKTGLVDYASIVFSGWGIYWVIAVLSKTSRIL